MRWPTISVVVVNWNGAGDLAECLDSLIEQGYPGEVEVIVVDNGSSDSSAEIAAGYGGKVTLIRNATNKGFATASNQGMSAARGEFVALLNNDAVAEPGWLEALVSSIRENPEVGSCASKIMSYYDRDVFDNVGHVVFADGLSRGRGRLERDRGQYEKEEEIFCASGCAVMLRRSMLEEVGGFDDSFFAYCEDTDLGFRARLRGWRCVYTPAAVVFHKYSKSTETFSPLKALNVERNRIWVAVKNLPLPLLLASPFFTLARYFWQAAGVLSGRGASGKFAADRSALELVALLGRAYWQAVAGLAGAFRKRRVIQGRRSLSSGEVFRLMRRFRISAKSIALME